jgi:hypothetical protein
MDWFNTIQAIASVATAIGVFVAAAQLRTTKQQTRTQFEDDLTKQYREIARQLPIEALLGEELGDGKQREALPTFYRYIDLSNEQTFLRLNGRVSEETWYDWCDGMKSHFTRPAFKRAWEEIKVRAHGSFEELRRLEADGFTGDPQRWNACRACRVGPGQRIDIPSE